MNIAYFVVCMLVLLLACYTDIAKGKILNESFYPVLALTLTVPFVTGFWEFLFRLALVIFLFFVYSGFIGGSDAKLLMMLIMLASPMKAAIAALIGNVGLIIYSFIVNPKDTKNSIMSGLIALRSFNPSMVKGRGKTVIFAPFLTVGFIIATIIFGI